MRHRTGARGVLLLICFLGLAGTASGATPQKGAVPALIFPVAGPTTYVDDFGQARAGGAHQGNDLMAAKKTPAVAVEAGRVKFWTTSASAGCMLYLYGASGTTYLYIHLNNDLTMRNDNRGKCVPGVSYARGLKDGAKVQAGQMIGYVGDSGDANGIASHLHFEVHPGGGAAVSPYPYLQTAQHLLFYAKAGTPFSLALTGTVVSSTDTTLTLTVSQLRAFPMNLTLKQVDAAVDAHRAGDRDRAGEELGAACPTPPLGVSGRAGRRLDAARARHDEGDARRRRRAERCARAARLTTGR
jgi:Membrane proteins related to metalloendopeptidases